MESLAAFPDGEWDSFNRMFSTEELDFTQQILHQFSFPMEHDEGLSFINSSTFCPIPEGTMSIAGVTESLSYSSNAIDSTFHYNSQESSQSSNSSGSVFVSPPNLETYCLSGSNHVAVTNDITMSLDMSMDIGGVGDKITGSFPPVFPNLAREDTVNVIEDLSTDSLGKLLDASHPSANTVLANELLLKRKFDVLELHAEGDKMIINSNSSENAKRRPRVSKDASKVYKNVQSKKNRKISLNGNEGESNIGSDGQSSSTCSSEDDIVSQDTNGVATSDSKASPALNLNGKTRASRGSATDPQSLYARKRRERINERLRILQNLVPNGTKVDISTMLEEAVHYVKFLQLQIKLLSSDDLWMYAPIAYNGIDIGLNEKISTLL
ncbi:hypothetical protein QUC31_000699 [Theobroma cacao]|uniref:Transcription factor bHLH85 n=2 Tax=Theobroma cacao TaxID=3641 RepID=A0AB32UVF1_THECC|nr:PREDICTED: transcription factor bHLH85 [Theobroma cacao]EOY15746.1 Root hair defective 6-like 2, putative [Theobroma cacao]